MNGLYSFERSVDFVAKLLLRVLSHGARGCAMVY